VDLIGHVHIEEINVNVDLKDEQKDDYLTK